MELRIHPEGQITTLYDETFDLTALGTLTITRASHIEPDPHGDWWAQIINGPRLGPYPRRSAALAAEVAWLTQQHLHGSD
ncbi:hypothetical protein GC163_20680 [bacterium]|nr:hypothetical protein [bacterium]